MKLGIIISLVLITFLGLLGTVAYRGITDPPTHATSPAKLAKKELPANLPPLFISSVPNGNAARVYSRIFDLYQDNYKVFTYEIPPQGLNNTLVDLLIEAMQYERVRTGFLDDHIPIQPGATPDFAEALEAIPAVALMRADEMYQEGNVARAILTTRAVWALGQRAFENNTRLYNRLQGLAIMLDAGEKLFPWTGEMGGKNEQHIRDWMEVVHEVDQAWQTKHELLSKLRPHIGNLLNIARSDKDPSFRIAAILKLGQVKFKPNGRGNSRAIDAIIEEAKNDSNPLIAQAGIAASRLTLDQLRKLH